MNYQLEIEAKEQELAKLKAEAAKIQTIENTLKVGQCYRSKTDEYGKRYQKILYVDESGYGYRLVIIEHFSMKELRIFQKLPQNGWSSSKDIKIQNKEVYFGISQAHNFERDTEYYTPISEEEYNQARKTAFDIMLTPNIPSNWQQATSNDKATTGEEP